jgi:hypothetical protein
MNFFFHRRSLTRGNALARISLAAAAAATMLSISIGLQGCIENPGTDHRLNQDRDFHLLAYAHYAGERVLELSVKGDSGVIGLAIRNIGGESIDSAAFLLQFGVWSNYSSPGWYYRVSKLSVMVRIADLQPGATFEYGAISRDIDLANTNPIANLLRYSAGAHRGNPLGGAYSGSYSLIDTAGRRTAGPLNGLITVDGEYQFLLEPISGRGGIRGNMYGTLDSSDSHGVLISETHGGTHVPTIPPSPFTLASGELKGTLLPTEIVGWCDSLNFQMHPTVF